MKYILPSLTVLLIFACLVAYEYIRDLRRDLKDAKRGSKDIENGLEQIHRQLLAMQGKPLPTERRIPDEQPQDDQMPFFTGGIGPSAINDRELRKRREKTPRNPSADEIANAARAATGEETVQ